MQKIADQLFGNLAIAPTLQDARKIAYDQQCGFMTCTLDGDVVDPHGVVQGGYRQKRENILNLYQNFMCGGRQDND